MPIRPYLLSTTVLSGVVGGMFLTALTAHAADLMFTKAPLTTTLPAVDGFNAKFEPFGGSLADREIYGAKGSFTVPLATRWGLQIDGVGGSFDSDFFAGVGAHLFYRDPTKGMIGIYASHTYWDRFGGLNATHVAAEGEYYWNRWTLRGIAGIEFGNSQTNVTVVPGGTFFDSYDVKTRFFDKIDLSYYLTDDLKLSVGHRYTGGLHAAALGAEWAFGLGGGRMASLFVEGRVGENDYHGVWGGVKVYFGQHDKPLIARQRQDDPNNWMPETLFTITNTNTRTFVANPVVPPPTITCPGTEILVNGQCIVPDGTSDAF